MQNLNIYKKQKRHTNNNAHAKNNKTIKKPYNISDKVDIPSSYVLWKCILDFNHSTEHEASKVTVALIESLSFLHVPPIYRSVH
jgi:putative transposon-encoded protein